MESQTFCLVWRSMNSLLNSGRSLGFELDILVKKLALSFFFSSFGSTFSERNHTKRRV